MLAVPGQSSSPSAQSGQADASATPAVASAATNGAIRIGKVARGDLNGVLTFSGSIQTEGELAIIPRVSAPLNKLDVDVGSHVMAGDTIAELDHADLDEQVLAAQAAQASAESKLDDLKAGPKPEVVAAAKANYNAAQARLKALQNASANSADDATLEQHVKDAQAALDQAQAAMQPDQQVIATADVAAQAAQAKLAQIQADPTNSKNQPMVDAARADVQRANDAATRARTPTGTQTAVNAAQNQLLAAQQAQLIARLSSTAFDLDQAKALADAAQAEVNLADAPASAEELNAAQSAVEQAYSQAELLRARVRDATVTSPITGIVTDIKATVGSTVGPSASIMTVVPPNMQIVVRVDQSQLSQVQVGQSANLSVESFPRDAFSGTVKAIAPVLDPRTRTAAAQIEVSDPQNKLKPGMFAQIAIQLGARQGTLIVPKDAVLTVGSVDPTAAPQTVVYSVNNGRLHKQVVTVGVTDGKNTEILDGLQEGVDLVLNPRTDFLEGQLISST
jgi:HlyD family secretion protein